MKWFIILAIMVAISGCTGSTFEYEEEESKMKVLERPADLEGPVEVPSEDPEEVFDLFGWTALWIGILITGYMIDSIARGSRRRRW